MLNKEKIYALAREVINTEAQAVLALLERIDENFLKACEKLLRCEGRIVVMGMGKPSHIASKIAATLASTGSPAFFVHPGEASHGDIGVVMSKDVVLAISNSGNTPEILAILPTIKQRGVKLIALTGNPNSTLAKEADVHIDVSVVKEACPMGLAPTSSTTAALVMGDALAVALLEARGFTAEDFALSHPGGVLGKRLLLKVDDVMRTGEAIPKVKQDVTLDAALMEMTQKRLGMTTVVDNNDQLIGIFTDGDLRRTLEKRFDVHTTKIIDVMTRNSKTIPPGILAIHALQQMEEHAITVLLVVNQVNNVLGIVHMHDLLKAGVI
jgi:arabinose-5-phosphate isomerase